MNKLSRRSLSLGALTGLAMPWPSLARAAGARDFDLVLDRMRTKYAESLPTGDAAAVLGALSPSGDWADVDYDDRSVGNWRPIKHLERARALAVAWSKPGHPLNHKTQASDGVVRALRGWLRRAPKSDNWWHETIGQQLVLIPILVLMGNELPGDLRAECVARLNSPSAVPAEQATGQNLVWYLTEQVARGALTKNAADLAEAQQQLHSLLQVTEAEGIQADFSFHQHGPQLYSGGYGLGFLIDVTDLTTLLAETRWQLAAARVTTLANYAVIGVGSVIRGNWLDWSARGREFTRLENKPRHQHLVATLKSLRAVSDQRSLGPLDQLISRLKPLGSVERVQPYSRAFWRSDFVAHQTPAGYVSVKMCSPETVGTESGNGENLQGYWLPFGATFIVRQGNEYEGLPALMNWAAVPGVTCPDEVPAFQGYQRPKAGAACCVSNGKTSVAGLQLAMLETRAKKAWFIARDTMIALGADIQSSHRQAVQTTINQTRWQGDLVADGEIMRASGERAAVRWAAMNGVLYQAMQDTQFNCLGEQVRAASDRSNTSFGAQGAVGGALMTLRIAHGRQPTAAHYAYTVSFADAPKAGEAPPAIAAKVLANTAAVQAVQWTADSVVHAVCHAPADLPLPNGLTLNVSAPCSLILAPSGTKEWELTAATFAANGVALTLSLRTGSKVLASTTLRADQTRGKAPATAVLRT